MQHEEILTYPKHLRMIVLTFSFTLLFNGCQQVSPMKI
jgi:hypothetical protein